MTLGELTAAGQENGWTLLQSSTVGDVQRARLVSVPDARERRAACVGGADRQPGRRGERPELHRRDERVAARAQEPHRLSRQQPGVESLPRLPEHRLLVHGHAGALVLDGDRGLRARAAEPVLAARVGRRPGSRTCRRTRQAATTLERRRTGTSTRAGTRGRTSRLRRRPATTRTRGRTSGSRVKCDPTAFTSPQRNDIDAAIANLFAMHNRMHDFAYKLGFTETAFNAQVSNFGKGGAGNDPEHGNAQKGGIVGGPPAVPVARQREPELAAGRRLADEQHVPLAADRRQLLLGRASTATTTCPSSATSSRT